MNHGNAKIEHSSQLIRRGAAEAAGPSCNLASFFLLLKFYNQSYRFIKRPVKVRHQSGKHLILGLAQLKNSHIPSVKLNSFETFSLPAWR